MQSFPNLTFANMTAPIGGQHHFGMRAPAPDIERLTGFRLVETQP